MTKLEKLRFSSLVILGFFILAVGYHYWQSAYEGRAHPYSSPFFNPVDMFLTEAFGKPHASQLSKHHCFGDFFLTWVQNVDRDPYARSLVLPSNYPPFAHFATLPFSLPSYAISLSLFLTFTLVSAVAFSWHYFRDPRTDRWENAKLVMIFALLTHPMLMLLDRGNIEIVVFLFTWLGLASFGKHSYRSAFFLACATAMKVFPGLLLGLFLVQRRYKQLAFALFCVSALSALSLLFFKGGFWTNLQLIGKAAEQYTSVVAGDDPHYVQHTSNWQGMVACLGEIFPAAFDQASGSLRWMSQGYPVIRFVLLLYFAAPLLGVRRLAIWQLAAPLIFAMIVIPPAAFDYRLTLVLIPFALFVNCRRRRRSDLWYTLLFSLLMVPKEFVLVGPGTGLGTIINPVLMLTITGMVLAELIVFRVRCRRARSAAAATTPRTGIRVA
jgi:hypothetical protein